MYAPSDGRTDSTHSPTLTLQIVLCMARVDEDWFSSWDGPAASSPSSATSACTRSDASMSDLAGPCGTLDQQRLAWRPLPHPVTTSSNAHGVVMCDRGGDEEAGSTAGTARTVMCPIHWSSPTSSLQMRHSQWDWGNTPISLLQHLKESAR